MSDDGKQPAKNEPAAKSAGQGDDMRALRRLLLGQEQEELARVQRKLDKMQVDPESIGDLLPTAVRISREKDDRLAEALSPTIDTAIRKSVHENPERLVDAIFPLMGPAIRRAIIDTLGNMLQTLNQTLEHSFSPRAIGWRIEAWRTGKTFGEVVLLKTLQYRVEQVFLIHGDNGLLLQHCFSDKVAVQDGDMVSGMLTAIQDFMRDSFGAAKEETVDQLKVNELHVWIRRGRRAFMAIVIRGEHPPELLKGQLQDAVMSVQKELADELDEFVKSGDAKPFSRARPYMESLLVERKAERKKRFPILGAAAAIAILALLGSWLFTSWQEKSKWNDFVELVRREPGIVVTHEDKHDGKRRLMGLRDPYSKDPAALAREAEIDPDSVEMAWAPYHAADQAIALKRAMALLAPPEGVALALWDGKLRVTGHITADWIDRAKRLAPTIAGISGLEEDNLVATDLSQIALAAARSQLRPPAGVTLTFEAGVLTASGNAPQQWVEEARVLARSIPQVKQYVDRNLIAADQERIVLERAQRVLAPPDSVQLAFTNGVLLAKGTAAEQWVQNARVLARTIAGISDYRDEEVVIADRQQRVLARAKQVLQPPATVLLELKNDTLTAAGTATTRWLEEARLLSRAIEGVIKYDDAQVAASDRGQRVLDAARLALRPPASVTLSFDNDVLTAKGEASAEWIAEASSLATTIPQVARFAADELKATDPKPLQLARARATLDPPAGVTLSLDKGVLAGKGAATQKWVEKARILAPLLPGVSRFEDAGMTISDRDKYLLDQATLMLRPPEGVQISIAGRSVVASGTASHAWITSARRLTPLIDGIDKLDEQTLVDRDIEKLQDTSTRIERQLVFFRDNTTILAPDQERNLGAAMADARSVLEAARLAGKRITFEVTGHTDRTPDPTFDRNLSQSRADFIVKSLVQIGVRPDDISTVPAGGTQPLEGSESQRRVQIKVILKD